jgi:hypothetical protein
MLPAAPAARRLVDPDLANRAHHTDYATLTEAVLALLIVFLVGARNFIADLAKAAARA